MNDHEDLFNALNHAAILTETDLDGKIISANARFCEISVTVKRNYLAQRIMWSIQIIIQKNFSSKCGKPLVAVMFGLVKFAIKTKMAKIFRVRIYPV
ncbi:MAG: hypothetical protein RLZZ384_170 [Pseudomonadota bacterium]